MGYIGGLGGPGRLGSQAGHNQQQPGWFELRYMPALQQALQPLQVFFRESFRAFYKIDELRVETETLQHSLAQVIDKFLPLELRKGWSAKQAGELGQSNTPV